MLYSHLNLQAKTKLHMNQIKYKIKCLNIFIQQGCNRIKALESKMKYIKTLEKVQEDQVCIIKVFVIKSGLNIEQSQNSKRRSKFH